MSFPLICNEQLESTINNFVSLDRFPHAIIIEGESGTGRHTLANFLAKSAVCSSPKKPCGICNNCHLSDVGSHPDITVVTLEGKHKNISVDQIRELRNQAYIKAHLANKRVFIIDPADTMNAQSQNAILKVLEEPPQNVIFILIAASRTAFLPTIVSRCISLSPAIPEISKAAQYISKNSESSIEDIMACLKSANGRIGRAVELLNNNTTDKATASAIEFFAFLKNAKEWELLKLLSEFEKDRAATANLFTALKAETVSEIRKTRSTTKRAKALNEFYEQLLSFEQLLTTNINLSLLFSALVCKAVKLFNE